MGKLLKSGWIWAIAALAVVAMVVFLAPDRGKIINPPVSARGDVVPNDEPVENIQGTADVAAPVRSISQGVNGPTAHVSELAEPLKNVEASADQGSAPINAVGIDYVPDTNQPSTPNEIAEGVVDPASVDNRVEVSDAMNSFEPVEADIAEFEPAPNASSDVVSELVEPPSNQDAGLSLGAESAAIVGTISSSVETPVPNITAPAVAAPPNQIVPPPIANPDYSAPVAEDAPLLGAHQPLSLVQILLPGEAPQPGQIAPSFDLVRVAPDGSAVIAGRAAPGANVQVFSGKIPIAEVRASSRGEFVVFLDADPPSAEDLQVPAAPEGAELVVSQDDIIILPASPDVDKSNPIVVRRTPDAVQIVQPSGPAVPSHISLDLVSYSNTGAVQLAGRGKPGNTARIYADDQLAGEVMIAAGGNWDLEVSDIAEGRYVLRIDEIDDAGAVISRTESPFRREFPAADLPESFTQGAKIIVQPGNTLWLMATEAYGDGGAYTQIFAANPEAIRDPDLIYPGQIFAIPRVEE